MLIEKEKLTYHKCDRMVDNYNIVAIKGLSWVIAKKIGKESYKVTTSVSCCPFCGDELDESVIKYNKGDDLHEKPNDD